MLENATHQHIAACANAHGNWQCKHYTILLLGMCQNSHVDKHSTFEHLLFSRCIKTMRKDGDTQLHTWWLVIHVPYASDLCPPRHIALGLTATNLYASPGGSNLAHSTWCSVLVLKPGSQYDACASVVSRALASLVPGIHGQAERMPGFSRLRCVELTIFIALSFCIVT